MGNALRIARIFGIDIRIDTSWFIIFFLVTWSLADHYFPMVHPGWQPITYWSIGIVTAALFFSSVVAHELSHSLVSQAFGVPVRDITLFIFGGVARISEEPRRAREELLMALAGPAMSLTLAGLFGLLWSATAGASESIHALTGWLALVNLGVGLFNLIPGFPLDGGRVLRAVVWSLTGSLGQATRIAAGLGRIVAIGFILWGILQIFAGNWANGLWVVFIGWFLESAAARSSEQLELQQAFAGHIAREVMLQDCPAIPRHLTLDVVVDQVVLPSGRRCFPVVEDGRLQGLLTLHRIKAVPRGRWPLTRVEQAMIPRMELKTVKPTDDLSTVFDRMVSEDVNQFPVVEAGRFLGIVARDGLLSFIRTRADLGLDRMKKGLR